MTTVLLTTTSASPQTWNVPADAPAGTPITIEAWGAGAGASGSSTSFRAGGAGGSYASTPYIITSPDVASGIAYTVQAGSAGTAAANPTAGPDTLFGPTLKNLVSNNTNYGAVVGGAFPTNWAVSTPNGLTVSVAGLGTDAGTGLPYIDISYVGTTNATAQTDIIFTANNTSLQAVPASASVSYTCSAYMSATNTTGLNSMAANVNWNQANGTFISNPNIFTTTISSFTRYSGTVTSPALTAMAFLIYRISYNTGAAINLTLRFAGVQFEQAASASAVQSTPAGLLARGGAAPSGTTGGAALNAGLSMGTILFAGGGGASHTSGGGGGGSAGAAGAGATATTATGGAADAGSGGAANTSNVEGGGGGTASASGHVGGDPGGGAGANTSTGSGGTGGRGQIRITYASLILTPQIDNLQQFIPVMAQ